MFEWVVDSSRTFHHRYLERVHVLSLPACKTQDFASAGAGSLLSPSEECCHGVAQTGQGHTGGAGSGRKGRRTCEQHTDALFSCSIAFDGAVGGVPRMPPWLPAQAEPSRPVH